MSQRRELVCIIGVSAAGRNHRSRGSEHRSDLPPDHRAEQLLRGERLSRASVPHPLSRPGHRQEAVIGRFSRRSASGRTADRTRRVIVYVNQCTRHIYGSIAYRQCRVCSAKKARCCRRAPACSSTRGIARICHLGKSAVRGDSKRGGHARNRADVRAQRRGAGAGGSGSAEDDGDDAAGAIGGRRNPPARRCATVSPLFV